MNRSTVIVLFCLLPLFAAGQQKGFSGDSAYANLKILAGEIGPRPMGSPAEQRALAFATARFAAYGCQESYVMPIAVTRSSSFSAGGTNTSSGVAVGVSRGKSGRIILIGGHIDSAGPNIPGANDDGSGAASVIELARVICGREHQSTVVFCCWGGEEMGLVGSDYFVHHFPLIDSVDLMLQIDMADGAGFVDADPDAGYQVSAPRWLVEATYDIFYNELKYSGLQYPTQAATLNTSFAGATGSDHIPFLDKGIPAIDFTTDVGYPIHQPLDNLSTFDPSGLKRSGELVLRLAERFDGGVPSRTTEQYWLLQLGNTPVFFSHPVLWGIILVSVLFSIMVMIFSRRHRKLIDPLLRIRWSGVRILLFVLIIQTLIWYSENIVGLLSGYRYPWVGNFGGFVVLGVVAGLIGVWCVIRLAGRMRLSHDPNPYYLRALGMLLAFTIVLSLGSVELGPYGAVGLLLISLAVLIKPPSVKLLLVAAAAWFFFRLIFFEDLPFLQRMLIRVPAVSIWTNALINAWYVVFFTVLSLPFAYAFAAVYRESAGDLLWLKRFRASRWLALLTVAAVAMVIYLSHRPVYNSLWQRSDQVQERFNARSDSSTIEITSAEYLRGLQVRYDGVDTIVGGRVNSFRIHPPERPVMQWCTFSHADAAGEAGDQGDSMRTVRHVLELHSARRPYTVTVSYSSARPFVMSSPWAMRGETSAQASRTHTISWYSFPEAPLVVPVTIGLSDTQKVVETTEVTFDSLAYPLALAEKFTYFTPRTIVTNTDTIAYHAAGDTQ